MPSVRDVSWAYETVTTDAGITIPAPLHEAGDLLLLFAMGDTGAPTWTLPSGFTQIFARNNTVSTVCAWKIATGSEPTSYTVGATVNETYNGFVVSVEDVHDTTPINVFSDTTQAAAAKYQMPQVTTTVNNCLLLFIGANSNVGVPSLIEGPVFGLLGADGAAESVGLGWGFQASAGATPNNVTCSNVSTGAGVKATIAIRPPAAGAQIIPAYCRDDTSIYINPINGTSAFNGDTALAATADTNYGTTLGGFTAVDATVAAAADVGINSFHSMGQLTSASSINMAGADLVLAAANRPNITGRNVLCHVQASTPLQLQRLGSIGSNRGVWFGCRSGAATDYKIWRVLGADSPNSAARPAPIIINPDAPDPVASDGTLNAASILSFGFWCNGSAVGSAAMQFGQLWVMGVTTVVGGNASSPINVSGIVGAVAKGKERLSAIQQGANQMLLLQEVQIGNGSESTYLDLNATAIEFPSQRNVAAKQISYNSVDNKVGITYRAAASDTIKHRNSVVSSPSPFYWRIHASSSASATYDFSGLSIIGAGDVQLRPVTVFDGMAFTSCPTIVQNGASISNCTFSGSTITSDDPSDISGCSFSRSGAGHAIVITAPGTYGFAGNTFSGYGADGSTEAAVYNNSGGAVTLNISGGGSTPTVRNGAGASTTVNNTITLTLAGLQVGSDIVILDAGTTTERVNVDAHGSTSYNFSYSTGGNVDIGVFKVGYVPFYIRNFALPASNGSVPINQVVDRNYVNP